MHAVIVANAPWRWRPDLVALARGAELLLAADGGANLLAAVGLRPAAVVGDLDSVHPSVRAWLGEEAMLARPDQERTDLDKALAVAIEERGATTVTVLAATAGRLDHAFENLGLAARWRRQAAISVVTEDGVLVPVLDRVELATEPNQLVSLLPLGRIQVWTRGLRWELDGQTLDPGTRISVSNRATGTAVEVRVAAGALLVFLAGARAGC
ncbi:MAG: thiamine diphosphokinase [Thermoanaerobaculaceae bacterium]|nr:thiamine diphosphokinase [Thermoanaerobaculaceae bacterium]MDI9620345.1 thiamine diphosphokinase [Acidobacteriota bacterium]NLH10912.1 thiamine diphosphokinase [Holophagae bacterium]HPW54487.1 thiamine diphosphokinase [Thermoanaerobaculaceae bacterium]